MKEKKTKAFNGTLKPSLYEALHRITYMRQEKINQLLEQWVNSYINQHSADLEKWDKTFGKGGETDDN